MSDCSDRLLTKQLTAEQLKETMLALADELRELRPEDPPLSVRHGWGCEVHPALCHIDMAVPVSGLRRFMDQSIRQQIVLPGESDLHIRRPKRLSFVFCHEGDLHSNGTDWKLEATLWTRGLFTQLPLREGCPGFALREMALKQGIPSVSGPDQPPSAKRRWPI